MKDCGRPLRRLHQQRLPEQEADTEILPKSTISEAELADVINQYLVECCQILAQSEQSDPVVYLPKKSGEKMISELNAVEDLDLETNSMEAWQPHKKDSKRKAQRRKKGGKTSETASCYQELTTCLSKPIKTPLLEKKEEQGLKIHVIYETYREEGDNLCDWLKQNIPQLQFRSHWEEEPKDHLPVLFTAATAEMRELNMKYGQILCITICSESVNAFTTNGHTFSLALFTVPDTNQRPLLVGFAWFAQFVPASLSRICSDFFQIQKYVPSSILTNDTKQLQEGIGQMQKQGLFKGIHLLNRQQVFSRCLIKVKQRYDYEKKVIANLKLATKTKCPSVLNNIKKALEDDPIIRSVAFELFTNKPTIFYLKTGNAFVGLGSDLCGLSQNVFDSLLSETRPMKEVVQSLCSEAKRLRFQSQTKFQLYEGTLLKDVKSDRIDKLKETYQRLAFKRFAKNYLQAVNQGSFTTEEPASHRTYVRIGESEQCIRQLRCSCTELEKTGIPCAHLIFFLLNRSEQPFEEFLSSRWRKERPASPQKTQTVHDR